MQQEWVGGTGAQRCNRGEPYQLPTWEGCCLPAPFSQWHTRYTPSSVQAEQTQTWAESGRPCCVGSNGPVSAGDAEDAATVQSLGDAQETPKAGESSTAWHTCWVHAMTFVWAYILCGDSWVRCSRAFNTIIIFMNLSLFLMECIKMTYGIRDEIREVIWFPRGKTYWSYLRFIFFYACLAACNFIYSNS